MEVAGLAIGVVGLSALVDSCKRLMSRIESFQHIGSEAWPVLVEFSASKHLFDRWLQHVKVSKESIQTSSGNPVDEKTARVVRDLVSCIEESLKTIEAVVSDLRPSGADGGHVGDKPTLKRRPTGFSTKTKVQWAFSKKEKAVKGVQDFYRLIQKLHAVIPVSGPSGDPKHEPSSTPDLPDELAAHLDELRERYKAEDRRGINQWLGAKSTDSYYEERLHDCQTGTCSWIFDRADFVSWESSDFPNDSAKLLWLHAPAGFGKTTICAKIVESFKISTPAMTASYFFSERENDTYAILRSWISQAAYQHDSALQIVANNPRLSSTATATHSDLEQIFRSIAQSAPEFTFVVDGLDQCEDSRGDPADFTETNRHQFVMKLRKLVLGTRTRLMVVSRPDLDIRSAVHPEEAGHGLSIFEIPMTEDDVDDDLKAFSKAIVDKKLSNRSEGSRAELANSMAERASGMFLWVKLHQSALRHSKNQNQLREIILHMPEGLNRTYDRNMERIKALDRMDRSRAYLILTWIMVGDSLPTVGQIAIGFAVQRSRTSADLQCDELPVVIDQDYVNEEIISTCAGLVEVNVDSRVHSLQHQSIRFVHSSVREYLTQVAPDDSMSIPFSDNDLQRGFLCTILLRFLSYDCAWELLSSSTTNLQLHPFLDFATLEWIHYFPVTVSNELWIVVNNFFSLNNTKWVHWRANFEEKQICLGVLWMDNHIWEHRMSLRDTLPHYMLETFHTLPRYPEISDLEIINETISQRMEENVHPFAELSNMFEKLKALVKTSFPQKQTFENGFYPPGTRTFYALLTKHVELAKTVISNDPAPIDTPAGLDGSALQLACSFRLFDMVKELIDRGANVSLQTGCQHGCALAAAAYSGDERIVDTLLRAGANVNTCNSLGKDALIYALQKDRTDVAILLLQHGAAVNIRYSILMGLGMNELTALLYAALDKNAEIFDHLLEKGADTSAQSGRMRNCLHLAAESGAAEIVDKIMDRAEFDLLNARDVDGFTPLCSAIANERPEISRRLISGGAKLDIPSNDGMTPLHWAVDRALPDVVQAILERGVGVDVNAQVSKGYAPLHIATWCGTPGICRKLLDHGADLELKSYNGDCPIHCAVRQDRIEIVNAFLEKHSSVLEAKDSVGSSPLHHAAAKGFVKMARHLLNHDANVHAQNDDGWTPLHIAACVKGQTEMIDLLISCDADVSALDHSGMTPILTAARSGQPENYEVLLRHGADEKATDKRGRSALHHGVLSSCTELVQYLIDRKFDANHLDDARGTAFHYATYNGLKDILALLLDRGAYKVIFDRCNRSPLQLAVAKGHLGCLGLFLDRGLTDSIDTPDYRGRTPLQNAAHNGHTDILRLLLVQSQGRIENRTETGNTPLLLAILNGHALAMETLIEHGADTSALDPDGWTPLQLAVHQEHLQAVKVLLKDLHRQMSLSEMRPIAFSAKRLRRSRSLPQIEELSAFSEEEEDDDTHSLRSV